MHVGRTGEQSLRISCDGEQLVQVKEYEYLSVIYDRDERIMKDQGWGMIDQENKIMWEKQTVYYAMDNTLIQKGGK